MIKKNKNDKNYGGSRILLTINSFGRGGAEMSMAILGEKLAKQGNSVTYLAFWKEECTYDFKWLINSGVKVITLGEDKRGIFNDLYDFYKIIKKEKPEYIYSAMLYANLISQVSALILKINHIASVRNDPSKYYESNTFKKILFLIVMIIQNKIIFISRKSKENYLKTRLGKFLKNNKVYVLHNPIDVSGNLNLERIELKFRKSIKKIKNIFNGTSESLDESNMLQIVIVSRLVVGKGILEVLDQIKEVLNNNKKIAIKIYGDGPLKSEIADYIEKFITNGNAVLMGYSSDIDKVYANSDLLIFPSMNEGFGRVPFEAFMRGNLILCNEDVSIIDELIAGSSAWRTYNKNLDLMNQLKILSNINASECCKDVFEVVKLLSSETHLNNFTNIQLA